MQLRWFNFLPFFLSTLVLGSILFISSCDSHDNEKIACRLSTVRTHNSTVEYLYNAENKVEAILIHGEFSESRTDLEYNDEGQLIKVIQFEVDRPELRIISEVIYEGQSKPQKAYTYGSPSQDVSDLLSVTTFDHDEKGRLVKRETDVEGVVTHSIRFEYNDENNVARVFFTRMSGEILSVENVSFDKKSKYYLAPELETLHVYLFGLPPGRNNALKARFYSSPDSEPVKVTYEVNYDANGQVTSSHASNYDNGGNPDFDEVAYSCPL